MVKLVRMSWNIKCSHNTKPGTYQRQRGYQLASCLKMVRKRVITANNTLRQYRASYLRKSGFLRWGKK